MLVVDTKEFSELFEMVLSCSINIELSTFTFIIVICGVLSYSFLWERKRIFRDEFNMIS